MKNNTTATIALSASIISGSLAAQEGVLNNNSNQEGSAHTVSANKKTLNDYIDFSLDARLRYEFREEGTADPSHAATLRVRPGITLLPKNDLSFFVEGEFTEALVDDFNSGPQSSLSPFTPGNTAILDPETTEVNRAFVQYKKNGFLAKVGRQRIILDNAAFVGNLIWRQNEQTYDAATISYNNNNFGLTYSYVNRVNRIFGSDASGIVQALEGDIHLLNGWKKIGDDLKVGAYTYLIDIDDATSNGFANRASSNTYGGYIDYKGFHAEYALQQDGGDSNLNRGTTDYASIYYHKKLENWHFRGGLEYRDSNFHTPLSTVHLFNGFADRFIGQRLGLSANDPGINNFYVHACTEVADVRLLAFAHYFYDDSFSEDLGWELDLVAIKSLTEHVKVVSKIAYFNGQDDDEIVQASLQVDYSF